MSGSCERLLLWRAPGGGFCVFEGVLVVCFIVCKLMCLGG